MNDSHYYGYIKLSLWLLQNCNLQEAAILTLLIYKRKALVKLSSKICKLQGEKEGGGRIHVHCDAWMNWIDTAAAVLSLY